MTDSPTGRCLAVPAIVMSVAAIDQVTKVLVTRSLGPGSGRDDVPLLGDLVTLAYTRNTGIAFGFLAGAGAVLTIGVLALTVAVAIFAWRGRSGMTGERIGVALVLGGAIGNLIDRARLGYVVDFVSAGAWPAFNVADAAITTGVVVVASTLLRAGPAPPATLPMPPSSRGRGRGRDDHSSPARDRATSVGNHG
ncbi:MAG: signal peptidase II [Chloroflexota bacterium]|nr:signal peptidase II [Chloroflexota bacterium]